MLYFFIGWRNRILYFKNGNLIQELSKIDMQEHIFSLVLVDLL